jgi:hypothetical protein
MSLRPRTTKTKAPSFRALPEALTVEERIARIERLLGLALPDKECRLCKGTGKMKYKFRGAVRAVDCIQRCVCISPAFASRYGR